MKQTLINLLKVGIFLILFFTILNTGLLIVQAEELTSNETSTISFESGGFTTYLNSLFRFAIIFSAISAVVTIVIEGFRYILARGSTSTIEKAKSNITQAILGLLLVLVSYLILYSINPDLVGSGLSIPSLTIEKTYQTASSYSWKLGDNCDDFNNEYSTGLWTNASEYSCNAEEKPSSYYLCCGYTESAD